jgi:hypothetical protein
MDRISAERRGRIVHGDDHATSTVNTASLASEVRRFVFASSVFS